MRISLRWTLALAATLAACGGPKEPEQPAPQPTTPAPAPAPAPVPPPAPQPEPARPTVDPAAEAARVTASILAELRQMVHFDFDKSDIRPEDRALLDRVAAIMGANSGLRLRVAGHCDERGSDEYNLALGSRRSAAVKTYLANQGIDPGRVETVSFGEERPLQSGQDEVSWAANRRAEFEVTAGGATLRAP